VDHPDIVVITGVVAVAGNLVWEALYRRMGWPVLLIVRIVIELGWRVAWPKLAG
jgi:hypothetical protein